MSHEDRDLRTSFENLREHERGSAPSFFVRAAASRTPWRFALGFVALLMVVLLVSPSRRPLPIEQLSQWESPTASLLDVPESPLITTVPSVTR